MANPKAQAYRRSNAAKFKQLGENVWGGYRKGMPNGPEPSTDRGRRRNAKRNQPN